MNQTLLPIVLVVYDLYGKFFVPSGRVGSASGAAWAPAPVAAQPTNRPITSWRALNRVYCPGPLLLPQGSSGQPPSRVPA